MHTLPRQRLAALTSATLGALLALAAVGCDSPPGGSSDVVAHDAGHAAHADHAAHAGLSLDNGNKWQTDTALRAGMHRIRTLAEPLGTDASASSVDAGTANDIALGIREQVAFLIANCKLEPAADEVLHVLIGELLAGADALADPARQSDGAERVRHALLRYPVHFDDPGWALPAAVHAH